MPDPLAVALAALRTRVTRVFPEDLINVAAHLSTHAGQIVWIAKMLAGGSIREVWIKTHRNEGAWKPV